MGGAQGTWGGTGHHGGGTSDVGGTGTRAPWGATWDTGVPGHTGGRGFPLTPPPPPAGLLQALGALRHRHGEGAAEAPGGLGGLTGPRTAGARRRHPHRTAGHAPPPGTGTGRAPTRRVPSYRAPSTRWTPTCRAATVPASPGRGSLPDWVPPGQASPPDWVPPERASPPDGVPPPGWASPAHGVMPSRAPTRWTPPCHPGTNAVPGTTAMSWHNLHAGHNRQAGHRHTGTSPPCQAPTVMLVALLL